MAIPGLNMGGEKAPRNADICGFVLAPGSIVGIPPRVGESINIDAILCQNIKPCPHAHHRPDTDTLCGRCSKPKRQARTAKGGELLCNCGRPDMYTPETLAKAREYRDLKMPNFETDEEVHSVEGMGLFIGVSRKTIYEWLKDPARWEFGDIYEQVMGRQAKKLIKGGLNQSYGQTIAKLMLTKHGYHDKVENLNVDVPVDEAAKKKGDDAIKAFLADNK